jgi:hypothetical protein
MVPADSRAQSAIVDYTMAGTSGTNRSQHLRLDDYVGGDNQCGLSMLLSMAWICRLQVLSALNPRRLVARVTIQPTF